MDPQRQITAEHHRFDSLCEGLEEYDALPSVAPADPGIQSDEQPDEQLDGQILALLVSP
jgi:hypothetical protein